jgi:hypothetical protein
MLDTKPIEELNMGAMEKYARDWIRIVKSWQDSPGAVQAIDNLAKNVLALLAEVGRLRGVLTKIAKLEPGTTVDEFDDAEACMTCMDAIFAAADAVGIELE